MLAIMRRYRRTTLITAGCLSVLVGIGLSRKIIIEPGMWWLVFVIPALLFLRRKTFASLVLVVSLGLILGLWRGSFYTQRSNDLKQLSGQKVTIQVTSTADSIYSNNSQIEFTAGNVLLLSTDQKQLPGSFKISGFGENMIYRGDIVEVSGKFYPMRGSNQGRISYAQLERVSVSSSWINKLTRNFNAGMQNALPEPQASFALGLLIGQRSTLPPELLAALTTVGLVHIVAVSGYNLTILVNATQKLRIRSRYQRLALSLVLIGLFVLVTGFSASIVRAALVSLLSLWAWYYGRKIKPVLLIAFAAAVTGLFNPFYVWGDLAWYLSFLAFFGVLVIAPAITARIFKVSPKMLTIVLIETISAEIMTLPLIMMTFGQLSLISLLANVLIVPLVPYAMLLSAIGGAAGTWLAPIAGWFAWPAKLLLDYMLGMVRILSDMPHASIIRSISVTEMIGLYSLILVITTLVVVQLKRKNRELEVSSVLGPIINLK
jgi:competence protein ComEC